MINKYIVILILAKSTIKIDKHKIYNINKVLEDTKLIKKNTDIYFYYKILDNPFKT